MVVPLEFLNLVLLLTQDQFGVHSYIVVLKQITG